MSFWTDNLAAGQCGRCGKCDPEKNKSRCKKCADSVNAAVAESVRRSSPQKQARRRIMNNAWQKSFKGRMAQKRRRSKLMIDGSKYFNSYRKYWRKMKKHEL